MRLIASAATSSGTKRETNEDVYLVDAEEGFFCVCDGTRHPQGAEVARRTAEFMKDTWKRARPLRDAYLKEPSRKNRQVIELALLDAARTINLDIHAAVLMDASRAGACTTLDFAGFVGDQVVVGHVGDGRALLVREGQLTCLTRDHTRAQEMLSSGLWKEEQLKGSPFRHELTRAIGAASLVVPDLFSVPLQPGDRFILCSNGFSDRLERGHDTVAIETLKTEQDLAKRLVSLANERKTTDNATVIALVVPSVAAIQDQTQARGILQNPSHMQALMNVAVFQSLRENRRAMINLLSLATLRRFEPGATLMTQGDPSLEMVVILEGEVDILEYGSVVAQRKIGEAIGEIGFFTKAPRTATAIAKKPTQVLSIHADDFQQLLSRDPYLGLDLARGVIYELGRKLTEKARAVTWG